MREFSALQLKAYLESCEQQPLLLDVRQPWEFDVCRIENSLLLPMSQIPTEAGSLDSERETVIICHHGIRSRSVGRYLEQAGFGNIINLSGGVAQWAKTVDNQMPTY
ncbi:MAG: sulfurtransferase [Anaerolineae bacterium]|nr:sulfurtransferase [Anaerolineae bacterium]